MRSLLCLLILSASPLALAAGTPLDLETRRVHNHVSFVINADGTATETHAWEVKVLKESALQWAKRASISYSTSAQTAEVIEAYTRKAHGKRIDVPKDNYQVSINRGRGQDSPLYSDRTGMTVVFPEVAVGDSVVFSYKLIQSEPLFPKHFSVADAFSRQVAEDDLRVRFDYPADLWVQHEAHGLDVQEKSKKAGRRVIEWRWSNPQPVKDERENYSVYDPDREIGYAFSTFRDYAAIAAAYGERARARAAVTPRIQQLADEIAKDATTPRDQARALYDWVATKVGYAGNCIGIGAVVPRDLNFVLDNKIGDCKDHATLLQALLAARGIQSTQAMVNAGSTYRLPKIPVVSAVNHVMNYLPSMDLFVDSTSSTTPFGMLPFNDQDKPVLLVDNFKAGTRTPAPPVGSNVERVKSVFTIAPDGSISGTVEAFENGEPATQTRAWARRMTRDQQEDLVKDMFKSQGLIGSGEMQKDDPSALADSYHFTLTFSAQKYIKLPGAGAFYVDVPVRPTGAIEQYVQFSGELEKTADVVCHSGRAIEEYEMHFPPGLQILSVPDDVSAENRYVRYRATYRAEGDVLKVSRTLDNLTRDRVCAPAVTQEYKKVGDLVMEDLKSQVLYKLPKPGTASR